MSPEQLLERDEHRLVLVLSGGGNVRRREQARSQSVAIEELNVVEHATLERTVVKLRQLAFGDVLVADGQVVGPERSQERLVGGRERGAFDTAHVPQKRDDPGRLEDPRALRAKRRAVEPVESLRRHDETNTRRGKRRRLGGCRDGAESWVAP